MRCSECLRKLGLVDGIKNKCKCGKVTCNKHVLDHNCSIQHHVEYVKQHQDCMLPIVANKLEKI